MMQKTKSNAAIQKYNQSLGSAKIIESSEL
jgi:hypothetical protein